MYRSSLRKNFQKNSNLDSNLPPPKKRLSRFSFKSGAFFEKKNFFFGYYLYTVKWYKYILIAQIRLLTEKRIKRTKTRVTFTISLRTLVDMNRLCIRFRSLHIMIVLLNESDCVSDCVEWWEEECFRTRFRKSFYKKISKLAPRRCSRRVIDES